MPVPNELPLGLQLTADHGQDARVIRTAVRCRECSAARPLIRESYRQGSLTYFILAILAGDKTSQQKAAGVRAQMSDKEWKKTRENIKRRFRFSGDAAKLEAILPSLQASPPPR